jgi:hypothetical protein
LSFLSRLLCVSFITSFLRPSFSFLFVSLLSSLFCHTFSVFINGTIACFGTSTWKDPSTKLNISHAFVERLVLKSVFNSSVSKSVVRMMLPSASPQRKHAVESGMEQNACSLILSLFYSLGTFLEVITNVLCSSLNGTSETENPY